MHRSKHIFNKYIYKPVCTEIITEGLIDTTGSIPLIRDYNSENDGVECAVLVLPVNERREDVFNISLD